MRAVSLIFLALFSCNGGEPPKSETDEGTTNTEPVEPAIPEMTAERLLTRISLDVRGIRPTPAELDQVVADPTKVDQLADQWLDDPLFEERLVDIFAEIYLTRADYFYVGADQYGTADNPAFIRAVGEEPLRLAARVAASDLPWTEVVTADWTMSNEILASAWGMSREGGSGWVQTTYTDGRPAAGVLATNGLWWRYTSTDSNANRKRANQASRILLCNDYLIHPIEFQRDVDLLDEEAVNDAIHNNPGCVACHNTLDPLAAYFFGFWSYNQDSGRESMRYHPERERLWDDYLGVSPGFYGQPGDSLVDLGQQIAADPRFPACAVEQMVETFLRRETTVDDVDMLLGHREAFLAGDLRLKALVRSVLRDPRYRAADHPEADERGAVPTKLLSIDQLGSQVEALTGFAWTWQGYEMLANDSIGVRTLGGGADGNTVLRSATSPNATILLVQQRLAEAAAVHALYLAVEEGDTRLFDLVAPNATISEDPAAARAQIQAFFRKILGMRVESDGPEVDSLVQLWEEVFESSQDPLAAWAGVLTALLRDPDFLLY